MLIAVDNLPLAPVLTSPAFFAFSHATRHLFDAALLSFSNTPESLSAMVKALKGELSPRGPDLENVHLTLPGMGKTR